MRLHLRSVRASIGWASLRLGSIGTGAALAHRALNLHIRDARGEGAGFLYVQAWDLDVIVNEMLVESIFDLTPHLEQAVAHYAQTRTSYQCFVTPPTKEQLARADAKKKAKAAAA